MTSLKFPPPPSWLRPWSPLTRTLREKPYLNVGYSSFFCGFPIPGHFFSDKGGFSGHLHLDKLLMDFPFGFHHCPLLPFTARICFEDCLKYKTKPNSPPLRQKIVTSKFCKIYFMKNIMLKANIFTKIKLK